MSENIRWPLVVEWRLTGRCNERCNFCYGPDHSMMEEPDAVERLISFIGNSPVPVVRVTGGEPLLYPRINEVIEVLAGTYNKKVVLSTNGWKALSHAQMIVDFVAKLNMPIEGGTPDVHAQSSRSHGSLKHVIEFLSYLQPLKQRPVVKVGSVVSRLSPQPGYLRDVLDLILDLPVDRWKIYQFIPVGPLSDKTLIITDELFQQHCDDLTQYLACQTKPPELDIDFSWAATRDSAYFLIEPNGDVMIPMGDSRAATLRRIGNALSSPLADLAVRWDQYANLGNHYANLWMRGQ